MNRHELVQAVAGHDLEIFRMNDLRKLFPDDANLPVSVKRMVDSGVLITIAHGIYTLKAESLDVEKLATRLYYPSYISFESALAKYGIINQGLYGLTLATTRHSKKMTLAGVECEYCQLKESLYTGYTLVQGTYLASPEKALLDLLYLHSLGKRNTIPSEWMLEGLDRGEMHRFIALYPKAVGLLVGKYKFWE